MSLESLNNVNPYINGAFRPVDYQKNTGYNPKAGSAFVQPYHQARVEQPEDIYEKMALILASEEKVKPSYQKTEGVQYPSKEQYFPKEQAKEQAINSNPFVTGTIASVYSPQEIAQLVNQGELSPVTKNTNEYCDCEVGQTLDLSC